jgi:hypothetical protein
VLTPKGRDCIAAGVVTIDGIEKDITAKIGERGHRELRRLLTRLVDD